MLIFFADKMWVALKALCIESAKTVNEMTLNELVKLTTLWTTGPWCSGYSLEASHQGASNEYS